MEKQRKEHTWDLNRLQDKVDGLEEEREETQSSLNAAKTDEGKLGQQFQRLQSTNIKMEEKLATEQRQRSELEQAIESARANESDLVQEVARLESEVSSLAILNEQKQHELEKSSAGATG